MLLRAGLWIGHHCAVALAVTLPVLSIVGIVLSGHVVASLYSSLVSVLLVLTLLGCAVFFHNSDRLCLVCAARLPRDGSARAARRDRTLRLHHLAARHPWQTVAVVVGAMLVCDLFIWGTDIGDPTGDIIAAVVFFVPVDVVLLAANTHARLAFWCPRCPSGDDEDDDGWGDGWWDGDLGPAPDPDPAAREPAPA